MELNEDMPLRRLAARTQEAEVDFHFAPRAATLQLPFFLLDFGGWHGDSNFFSVEVGRRSVSAAPIIAGFALLASRVLPAGWLPGLSSCESDHFPAFDARFQSLRVFDFQSGAIVKNLIYPTIADPVTQLGQEVKLLDKPFQERDQLALSKEVKEGRGGL